MSTEHQITKRAEDSTLNAAGLRRYIAVNVIGDNPPPLTAEARALVRAALGGGPQVGQRDYPRRG